MHSLVHRKEQPYFIIALLISIPLYILLFISGIGIFFLAFLILTPMFAHWISLGHIRTNGVKITATQFPHIYEAAVKMSKEMELVKVPDMYILQSDGMLNAFATRFFGKSMVVLYSDLVNLIKDEDEEKLYYILAHELAHIKRNHVLKQLLILPANWVPFLGVAYSRACEYTCDHMAAFHTNNVEAAKQGLLILAAGPRLYNDVNIEEYQRESSKETGVIAWLAEKLSTHPTLPKRIHYLNTRFAVETDIVFKPSKKAIILGATMVAAIIGFSVLTVVGIKELINSPYMQILEEPVGEMEGDPFLSAAGEGDVDELNRLYEEGHDVNVQDEYGWNALHYIVYSEMYTDEELVNHVQSLLEMGVSPNAADMDEMLPADIAEDMGYEQTAEVLRQAIENDSSL